MDIYEYLGTTQKEVADIVKKKEDYYLSFPIKKSSGKLRWIDAPQGKLKELQYNILYKILYVQRPHKAATGFILGKGVKDGALRHLGCKVILTMDLNDFFPSIKAKPTVIVTLSTCLKVMDIIRRKKTLDKIEYNYQEIADIASLLTYKGGLPQGSPASPAMANLVCWPLDKSLSSLSDTFGKEYSTEIKYTRYADDLSFSSENKDISIGKLIPLVEEELKKQNFSSNQKKTRIKRPNARMLVTGIVINEKLGVPKWHWRNLRARLHNLQSNPKSGLPPTGLSLQEQQELRGQIEWIRQLHPVRGNSLMESLGKIPLRS